MPKLLLKKKAEIIAEYKIGKKAVINIGSGKLNDIVISDKAVSEYHCAITRKDEKFEIKDKNTLTGTRVNDRPITEKVLQASDIISVGSYTLTYAADNRQPQAGGAEEEPRIFFLLGIYGKFEGKKYEISLGTTYIGREVTSPKGMTNDIVLSGDMTVSKGHAKITCGGSQCTLTDVGSTGGVAVNGQKVGQLNEVQIAPGDEIAIGRTIFRFVEADKDDYTLPRQHRILLLKLKQPVSLLLTGALLAAAIYVGYTGVSGISIINSRPKKTTIDINRFWSPDDNAVRSALPPDYDVSSTPAIGDINNDGSNDIVYLNSSGLLCAWDGRKATLLWKPVEIYNSGKSSPVLYDMNNDGVTDIIVLSDTSMLYIIDGQTGGIIRREMLGGAISELSPAVGDLNGNGKPDIVVCSEEGMVHFVYSPGFDTEMQKYTEFTDGQIYASAVIIGSRKISPMVAVCGYNSKVFFFDGKDHTRKTVDLVEKTGKAHLITAAPAVGDLDGDGIPEIVVQSNVPQYISAIDITRFEVLWTYFVEPIPPAGIKHTASPGITDANGDGLGDVIAASANGRIYALKGKTGYPTGELLWYLELPNGGKLIASPALYDFDRDNLADIVIGAEDGSLYVLKNEPKRNEMETMATVKASNAPITSSVVIGDTNGDGVLDIVYSNMLNSVQILNSNVRTFARKTVWPMFLGNPEHTGGMAQKEDVRMYILRLTAGLLLCLMLLIVKILGKLRKMKKRPKVVYV